MYALTKRHSEVETLYWCQPEYRTTSLPCSFCVLPSSCQGERIARYHPTRRTIAGTIKRSCPGKLRLPLQVRRQHCFEQLPVVRDAEVEQFFGDHALAEVGVLAQQSAVETHAASGGATSPFALHGADLDDFRMHTDAFGPGFHFGLEHVTRHRFLQRLPLLGRGGSHGLARRNSFISFVATSTTASIPASISA